MSASLQHDSSPLERGFVWLTVDPHSVQPLVTQPSCHGGQVDRLDQAPGCVVAEAMRVDVGNVCASAELGDQVLDPARRVRPALAAEHGADGIVSRFGLDRLQRFARLGVQRQPPVLVAFADAVDRTSLSTVRVFTTTPGQPAGAARGWPALYRSWWSQYGRGRAAAAPR